MKKTFIRIVGAAIAAGLALAATSLSQDMRITISIVIGLPSVVLMIISRRQLGESFTVTPKAKSLVTTGLYSRFQHPIYLFLDIFLLCVIVVIDVPILILVWAIFVINQAIQSRREEKVLSAAFGAEYEAYQDRTWI